MERPHPLRRDAGQPGLCVTGPASPAVHGREWQLATGQRPGGREVPSIRRLRPCRGETVCVPSSVREQAWPERAVGNHTPHPGPGHGR